MQNSNLTSDLPVNDEGNTALDIIQVNASYLSGVSKLFALQNKYFDKSEIIVTTDGDGNVFDYLNIEEANAIGCSIFDASTRILYAVRELDAIHRVQA